ncbi:MAG TPA: amidohydrolase family protein, partial [Limnochordia bacterium]|nr:amidohydrolase family protein [Limnochordia bacterium]
MVLKNARLFDGEGNPWRWADVGVERGRIVAVGRLGGAAGREVFDLAGRALCPGLIDVHVHLDAALLAGFDGAPLLAQGITTVILGQDGLGYAPTTAKSLRYVVEYTAPINAPFETGAAAQGLDVAGYLRRLDAGVAVNAAYLLPHGIIRHNVMGAENRPATPDER